MEAKIESSIRRAIDGHRGVSKLTTDKLYCKFQGLGGCTVEADVLGQTPNETRYGARLILLSVRLTRTCSDRDPREVLTRSTVINEETLTREIPSTILISSASAT